MVYYKRWGSAVRAQIGGYRLFWLNRLPPLMLVQKKKNADVAGKILKARLVDERDEVERCSQSLLTGRAGLTCLYHLSMVFLARICSSLNCATSDPRPAGLFNTLARGLLTASPGLPWAIKEHTLLGCVALEADGRNLAGNTQKADSCKSGSFSVTVKKSERTAAKAGIADHANLLRRCSEGVVIVTV